MEHSRANAAGAWACELHMANRKEKEKGMTYTSLRSESFTQDSGRVGTSLFTVGGG